MASTSPPISAAAQQPSVASAGLTSEAAERLLSQHGPNDPTPVKRGALAHEIVHLFANPLVLILLLAATASAFLGDPVDAGIIIVVVVLGAAVNFAQTYRSQQAIEKLREHVSPTATVLRDGSWQELKRREIVPGDLVRLSAGDLVPADGHLLESRDLFVQQAALTGESMPAEKDARSADKETAGTPDAPDLVFLGSSVVSGTGIASIVATGSKTAFGAIAKRLVVRPPETEFERGLRDFGALIMRVVVFLVLFIVVVRIGLHKNAFESFLFAVALAVGLTPEFLPMISSVTLARGAVRMAREQVVVKHLPAIQNFGSIDVLCSDKTGTLTKGTMTLDSAVGPFGVPSETPLALAYVNSKFETGIRSPLDASILSLPRTDSDRYVKRDEIPFDFNRRRLSIVVEEKDHPEAGQLLITKGAPEGIVNLCDFVEVNGQVTALDSAGRERVVETYNGCCGQGFMMLAVAYRKMQAEEAFSVEDEKSLVLAGFLAFADPPTPDAEESLAALKRDGVQVKIITGDNELVARHVCAQVGLEDAVVVTGAQMEQTSDTALGHLAEEATIFARVSPMQKLRIILALKHRGHVVGYMGDGINDAPSLHAADVGISVSTAVDVARDAADIILLKPGLGILHKGILEGRRASANVLKYLLMGTSSNFGNVFSMAGASIFLPFLPMLPTQILLNNFLYDIAQLTIPSDNVDDVYIRTPQRWNITLVRNFMIFIGPISSLYDFLTFFVLLRFFHAGEPLFHTGWFVESLATQTLVLFVIRTMGNPLRSRPSLPLVLSTLAIVLIGCVLPYLPFAGILGFTPLPAAFFTFLAASTVTYLGLVEIVKRKLFGTSSNVKQPS